MEVIKDDYISKLEVVRILQKAYAEGRIKAKDGCVSVLNDVNSLPAAGVQPVKHGKWKHIAGMNSKCSVCSHYFPVTEFDSRPFDINFCPNCGARMDLDSVTYDRCSNYMDCDGNCFIDDTPCDCNGNIEKCKGR